MRPRQHKIPRWVSKSRRAGKKLPESGRIKFQDHCNEVPCEVTVELGPDLSMDPLRTSEENARDTEGQEFKGNGEAEMPLPWAEDCWISGSRYPTSEEEGDGYCNGDHTQPNLVIENFNYLPDSSKAKSSRSKRSLLLDSPETSGRTKRPCPQGTLGSTFYHHQKSSKLAMLRHEVRRLHTRLDAMTNAMNALYQHTQIMQKILEAKVDTCWGHSQREICIQKAPTWDQLVTPSPDNSYAQNSTPPLRMPHPLLIQLSPVEYPHSTPQFPSTERLEQLGSRLQSTPKLSTQLLPTPVGTARSYHEENTDDEDSYHW